MLECGETGEIWRANQGQNNPRWPVVGSKSHMSIPVTKRPLSRCFCSQFDGISGAVFPSAWRACTYNRTVLGRSWFCENSPPMRAAVEPMSSTRAPDAGKITNQALTREALSEMDHHEGKGGTTGPRIHRNRSPREGGAGRRIADIPGEGRIATETSRLAGKTFFQRRANPMKRRPCLRRNRLHSC
jgi:hypothetical protein